jgi:hypothetical protein
MSKINVCSARGWRLGLGVPPAAEKTLPAASGVRRLSCGHEKARMERALRKRDGGGMF